MDIGFTGTQRGTKGPQLFALNRWMAQMVMALPVGEERVLRHGGCVGADEEVHRIGLDLSFDIEVFPGYPKGGPTRTAKRGSYSNAARVRKPLPFLERNRLIVDSSDKLAAAPRQMCEVLRSGSWATVRYALGYLEVKPLGGPITVIVFWPDGRVSTIRPGDDIPDMRKYR